MPFIASRAAAIRWTTSGLSRISCTGVTVPMYSSSVAEQVRARGDRRHRGRQCVARARWRAVPARVLRESPPFRQTARGRPQSARGTTARCPLLSADRNPRRARVDRRRVARTESRSRSACRNPTVRPRPAEGFVHAHASATRDKAGRNRLALDDEAAVAIGDAAHRQNRRDRLPSSQCACSGHARMVFIHCSSCRRFFSGWSPVDTKMVTDHVSLIARQRQQRDRTERRERASHPLRLHPAEVARVVGEAAVLLFLVRRPRADRREPLRARATGGPSHRRRGRREARRHSTCERLRRAGSRRSLNGPSAGHRRRTPRRIVTPRRVLRRRSRTPIHRRDAARSTSRASRRSVGARDR